MTRANGKNCRLCAPIIFSAAHAQPQKLASVTAETAGHTERVDLPYTFSDPAPRTAAVLSASKAFTRR